MTEVPGVFAVEGVPRHYAWGSPTAIPALLGHPPDGRPVAELWFGAHVDGPSPVPAHSGSLDELLGADPARLLGGDVAEQFGGQLPFLLKILAADTALSIQVHPTAAQAQTGFDREQAAGIARDAPKRTYRDRNHKPEVLCALTRFTALCGFRAPRQSIAIIDALPASVGSALADVSADLAREDESGGLRAAFTRLLSLDGADRTHLVEAVVQGCRSVVSPDRGLDDWADGPDGAARVVDLCARDFPGDLGAVLSILLNPVVLAPGQAIFVGAGTVHCYLRGTGVEIMANSDNVLRCGLTPKHVDADEVLHITDFARLADPYCPTSADAAGLRTMHAPVPDFELSSVSLDPASPGWSAQGSRARLVLCTDGAISVTAGNSTVGLTPGHAAFVAADQAAVVLNGVGTAYLATVGEQT